MAQVQPSPLSLGRDAKPKQLMGQKLAMPTLHCSIVQVNRTLWSLTVHPPPLTRAHFTSSLWLYITFCVLKWETLIDVRSTFSKYQREWLQQKLGLNGTGLRVQVWKGQGWGEQGCQGQGWLSRLGSQLPLSWI